jgi:hypothetical protein
MNMCNTFLKSFCKVRKDCNQGSRMRDGNTMKMQVEKKYKSQVILEGLAGVGTAKLYKHPY